MPAHNHYLQVAPDTNVKIWCGAGYLWHFSRYQVELMVALLRKHSLALVKEFYASYTTTIIEATPKMANLVA